VGTSLEESADNFFGFKSTSSRYGERFRDGRYILVSFLFAVLYSRCPPCPAICKSGGTCSLVPYGVGATDFSVVSVSDLPLGDHPTEPRFPVLSSRRGSANVLQRQKHLPVSS